ncbi:MAG: DUF47 family protein [Chitinophagales bacterium]|nr:DUF47 family protein [Chitinophagales bacterium]
MSAITKLFTPGGKKFYDLFEQVADNLDEMASAFVQFIATKDRNQRKVVLNKIERLENKNDDATHRLFVELGRNFITPFDREDIHFIATSLDDVADNIWATAKQMYYFDIDQANIATNEVANLLEIFVEKLSETVRKLSARGDIQALIAIMRSMRKVTGEIDTIISKSLFELFEKKETPVEVIKLSDHYGMLQNLNNRCGEVINTLESMVIKYN